ncbi:hypothetical protein ACIQ2D_18835 [Lysinibacillus sp. NPDC097287]|uniref:hypothetical protein n=1 Tax=Lysinibacillus sp. NPDC097287 TaxID=3364144 RepID=UPI003822BD43
MKIWMKLSLLVILLAGCQKVIDWVDFIKWNGKNYYVIFSGALADDQYVGNQIGTVKFKVADNVTSSSYKIKDGDAAFHEKGTNIYALEGQEDMIAVKDEQAINGYRVYYENEGNDYKWHFKDLPSDEVKKVEIYEAYATEGSKRINEITKNEDIQSLLDLLKNSQEDANFQPNIDNGDPSFYEIVLHTNEPIAYKYVVQFDGVTYTWAPWDTEILSDEIKQFIPNN